MMIIEIIVISIIGTCLHFTYELSNHNKNVALFSAVNESTWEHIKIALSASFICTLVDGFMYGNLDNYFWAKFLSLLLIILIIPMLFYSYTYFTKKAILPIDILTFYIAITFSQMVFYYVIKLPDLDFIYAYLGLIGMFGIFGFFMIATLRPIHHFIFKDPITNKYGLKGHSDNVHHKNS